MRRQSRGPGRAPNPLPRAQALPAVRRPLRTRCSPPAREAGSEPRACALRRPTFFQRVVKHYRRRKCPFIAVGLLTPCSAKEIGRLADPLQVEASKSTRIVDVSESHLYAAMVKAGVWLTFVVC